MGEEDARERKHILGKPNKHNATVFQKQQNLAEKKNDNQNEVKKREEIL